MKNLNYISKANMNDNFISSQIIISNLMTPNTNNLQKQPNNSSNKNSYTKNNINLSETLKKAKEKDPDAILTLINKYSPLVHKYSHIYKLKDYEKDDLKQEGNIAIIHAINKFDLSKNPNTFDSYAINSIRNKYGTLTRTHAKRNTESSLNILTSDHSSEVINLIEDTINIEENYIKSEEISRLYPVLNSLSKEELTLINVVYLKKSHSLIKYCKENNLSYHTSRHKLKKSLEKLKKLLQ